MAQAARKPMPLPTREPKEQALAIEHDYKYLGEDHWKWSVWMGGPEENLNEVESVTYNLDPTFRNPIRRVNSRESKFRLDAEGWGSFDLYATVLYKNGS